MTSSIVEKLLTILNLVSEATRPQTFSELVQASGLHKSTMHRLLTLGIQYRLLQFDERKKVYLLGPQLFDLVRNAYRGYDIQVMALDEMMRLHKLVQQNVTIGVPVGSDTVYLRTIEAPHAMGPVPQPGMREPFHCSASGKALMAFRTDSAIGIRLEAHDFERYTNRTITCTDRFLQEMQQVRQTGYATNDREEYDNFVGIAAPVFNYLSEPIAVLNLWSLHQRCDLQGLERWRDDLLLSSSRVTALIGGRMPELAELQGH